MFAAAQIYNMLMEYNGQVTVKIDGIAASAASVIAMAGGEVHMSPVSMMMIHNPATIAIGDSVEMVRAKELLDEVKESIINAYELKTELPRLAGAPDGCRNVDERAQGCRVGFCRRHPICQRGRVAIGQSGGGYLFSAWRLPTHS